MGQAPTTVMDFDTALATVLEHASHVKLPAVERVTLESSRGRVLAEEVRADREQPPFDRSTRDGFAVRAADMTGQAPLRIVGQVRAGEQWRGGPMESGCAIEIMTGAPVPAGADAVVMVEHVERANDAIQRISGRTLRAGENIVPHGAEAHAGDLVLSPGTPMHAAEIALAASCGYAELAVFARPMVSVVATGDELVEVSELPEPWQIRNSNGYALRALVEEAGGFGGRLKVARDLREEVWERVAQGRMWNLMVFSGGVSMGEYDLVEEVLEDFGAEFFFTGVKMQPGRPVVFGRLPERLTGNGAGPECYFFGLPGNPVSTQVTFHCFVEPLLRAMCGAGVSGPRFVQATLAEDVAGRPELTRVLPALLRYDRLRPEVKIVGWQGSGDLGANARANCYAVLPPDRERFAGGDIITVLLR
ncbi:gephyrin-like molybdotransferase Glp [Granulicella sp. dw_53]|uniref:molybdopterin molybdotransferase MoeA n=1 Tax=Granulicella sp. dw_53 TaxID=2719792 RepID=UPI001BD4F031|nr:gephyrin-like molybdotransferase Glp [Granulicella sp. dw_53]